MSVTVVRVTVRVWQGRGKVWCGPLFVSRFLKQADGCHG